MRKLEKHLCLALCAWLYYDCILLYLLCPGKNPCRVWLPCQNTNPASRGGNWTRTPTTQSDLRFQSATHKDEEENTRKEIAQQALRIKDTVFTPSDSIRWHRAGLPPQQIAIEVILGGQKVKKFRWRTRMGHCGMIYWYAWCMDWTTNWKLLL